MTESLKLFIERNIDLIETKQLQRIYDNAYINYLGNELDALDTSALTDILSNVFDDEPIFDTTFKCVPPFYRLSTYNLKHIEIPEGIKAIGRAAFRNCVNLQYLKLPKTLSEIHDYAFTGCDRLSDVFYNGSIAEWNRIKIGINSFSSNRWIHQDKIVYCNDGEVII